MKVFLSRKKALVAGFLALSMVVGITQIPTQARKKETAKTATKATNSLKRDVRLKNGANIVPETYVEDYFKVGNYGLLTFTDRVPATPTATPEPTIAPTQSPSPEPSATPLRAPAAYIGTIDSDPEEVTPIPTETPTATPEVTATPTPTATPDTPEAEDEFADVDIAYSVENESVVTVNQKTHTYQIVGGGVSRVIMTARMKIPDDTKSAGYREETWLASFTFAVYADMSATKLSKTKLTTYMIYGKTGNGKIKLKKCPELLYYNFDYKVSKKADIDVSLDAEDGIIYVSGNTKGKFKVTVTINDRDFVFTYINKELLISENAHFMDVGKSFTLELKGYEGDAIWESSDEKIATVTQDGLVKGNKVGNAIITATIANRKIGCAVSVIKKGMTKVVNKAIEVGKTCDYSQPLRMKRGYYDCSSLVWRAYRKIGKYFGLKVVAPVAADEAKWCAKRKKILGKWTYKKFNSMIYRPGDCLFRVGANNGRYLGIYHVEMFAGYRVVGFKGDKPILNMLWANRPDNYYEPCKDIIGRP